MRHITIQYLKEKRKQVKQSISYLENRKLCELSEEDIANRDIWLGELFTYEALIKYMKGLNEREFQIQKKKDTL